MTTRAERPTGAYWWPVGGYPNNLPPGRFRVRMDVERVGRWGRQWPAYVQLRNAEASMMLARLLHRQGRRNDATTHLKHAAGFVERAMAARGLT